jgi:hypothetical protein
MGYGEVLPSAARPKLLTLWKVEDKFSPYAKETLAKLIKFMEVSLVHSAP